jgi:hypothetical protein
MNMHISCLVIAIVVIIFGGRISSRISSRNKATALTIVVAGVTSSARGEDHVPRLCRKSVVRGAAPEARRLDNTKTSASLEPLKEILSSGGMVGYCRGLVALVGSPTEHVHRGRVRVRVGANTFVPDDVLLPTGRP